MLICAAVGQETLMMEDERFGERECCMRKWEFFSTLNAGLRLCVVYHLWGMMGGSLVRESTLVVSVLRNSLEELKMKTLFSSSEGPAETHIPLLML